MKNRFLFAGAIISISISGYSTLAQAEVNVDLTQGMPGYWTTDGIWTTGTVPTGYTQSASNNQLTITALPGLTSAQSQLSSPHNNFWLGGLTGDFSASVTAVVTGNGGGGGGFAVDNNSSQTWAGLNFTSNQLGVGYGLFTGANVSLPWESYSGTPLTLNLARTGDNLSISYAANGGSFTNLLTLTGQNVLGAVGFDLNAWGAENNPEATQISFSNFIYSSAPAAISGMSGGTSSQPTNLSSATVGSIYGTVGDPGHESDFYTFYWGGGLFSAGVGIPGAEDLTYVPDDLLFKLCSGANCVGEDSYLASALADEINVWENLLQATLDAGFYTIGVVDKALVPEDPPFYINFETPTTATNEILPTEVPEPATLLLVISSLVALASSRKWAGRSFLNRS